MASPKHTYQPFEELVARIRDQSVAVWNEIEPEFIECVERFDTEYSKGGRKSGWYQSKARYFNDLIVALLSNSIGREVSLRSKRNSQLFDLIDIDICYPPKGVPTIAGEVKAMGTPPHPGNDYKARPGSQDLHKRVREVAFTSMDLKAAYAPPQPIGSFQKWVDSTSPGYFAFWAVRANDAADFERLRSTFNNLRAYCNGVGAVIYLPKSESETTGYTVRSLSELSIDRTLREMAQRIS